MNTNKIRQTAISYALYSILGQWKKYIHTSPKITSNGGKVFWVERKASSYFTSCYGHFNHFSFNYYTWWFKI